MYTASAENEGGGGGGGRRESNSFPFSRRSLSGERQSGASESVFAQEGEKEREREKGLCVAEDRKSGGGRGAELT